MVNMVNEMKMNIKVDLGSSMAKARGILNRYRIFIPNAMVAHGLSLWSFGQRGFPSKLSVKSSLIVVLAGKYWFYIPVF